MKTEMWAQVPVLSCFKVRIACGFFQRARGLIARAPTWLGHGEVLAFFQCNAVHTCFMSRPIDIAFIGADGVVLKAAERVGPWRFLRCARAVCALERFAPQPPHAARWYAQGERIGLAKMP